MKKAICYKIIRRMQGLPATVTLVIMEKQVSF